MAFLASQRMRHGAGPLVLAAALPFLFLHRRYQPTVSFGQATADLSDLAVLSVVATAAFTAPGLEAFRRTISVWLAWAGLALLVVLGTGWGATRYDAYPTATHAITAAKWLEYMLLAPSVVVLVRRARDAVPLTIVLVAWSCVATAVGVVQFFGALPDLDHTPAGRRKSSLLGYHDFSALSALALVVAFIVIARRARSRAERTLAAAAGSAGTVGLIIGGAFDALLGVTLAAAAVIALIRLREPRRIAAIVGVLLIAGTGTVAIRSQAVSDGLKFLGIKQGSGAASQHVQSYRQRALLAYIGVRIFVDHPLLGVGWEGSSDEYAYAPYLADAQSRFAQPPEALPSPQHPWGVQNAYVQALADLGPGGLLILLAALITPIVVAARRGTDDLRLGGICVVLVACGVWNGFGLVAGIPLDALTWLGVGLAAASANLHESHTGAV